MANAKPYTRRTYIDLPPGEGLRTRHLPVILYGRTADTLWLYVHGKHGYREEAEPFARLACAAGAQVMAFDLPEHGKRKGSDVRFAPWDAVPELKSLYCYARAHWKRVCLHCTSIGAWFAMLAVDGEPPDKTLFVSPILDMESVIRGMMSLAGVDEPELRAARVISSGLGEDLSWRYLQYAIEHPVSRWDCPTAILYPENDGLTERDTVLDFSRRFNCELSIAKGCEHWFHTPRQLALLRGWENSHI